MKLGLLVGAAGPRLNMDLILEAEKLGFDSVWTGEAYGSDAVTPLAWIGSRTAKIKLGAAILQMPARTPAMTAMTAMTLDALSGGRFVLGVGPSVVLLLFSPDLFAWIFGANWRAAGELAKILAPLYFLNFIASPLSYVFFVAGKQKADLLWQVALAVTTVGAFALPGTLQESISWYATGYSLLYIVYLYMSWHCSHAQVAPA